MYFVDETCRLKHQFSAEASIKKLLYYDDKNVLVTVTTSMMLTLHTVSDEGDTAETMKVAELFAIFRSESFRSRGIRKLGECRGGATVLKVGGQILRAK